MTRAAAALLLVLAPALAAAAPAGPGLDGAAPPGPAPRVEGARRVHAEPHPERAAEAERLLAEAEDLRRRLAEAAGERASVLDEARRLDLAWALRRAEADAARAEADRESAAAAIAARRAASLAGRVAALRRRAALVARALYVEGPDAPLLRFLGGDAAAGRQLGSALVARQSAVALDLRRAEEAASAAALEASRRAARATSLAAAADAARAEAQREASARQARLRTLADRSRRDEDAAAEKEAAASELLRDLAPGALARRRAGTAEARRRAGRPVAAPADVALPGLESARGRLPWPIAGRPRVLEAWGTVRDARRGTSTLRHGVTLEARRGEELRAIADGRVLFVDWYKGFGRCLVLDHGQGFLSVMAHADAFTVEAGDVVRQGDVVGEAGDTGSLDGPRLWLQIQRAGESVDPLQWLRR